MDTIDRFFDAYDRFLPRYFGEFLAAALVFGGVAFFAL